MYALKKYRRIVRPRGVYDTLGGRHVVLIFTQSSNGCILNRTPLALFEGVDSAVLDLNIMESQNELLLPDVTSDLQIGVL